MCVHAYLENDERKTDSDTHPPEVLSAGLRRDTIAGVDVPLKGPESGVLGNVLLTEDSCDLQEKAPVTSQPTSPSLLSPTGSDRYDTSYQTPHGT